MNRTEADAIAQAILASATQAQQDRRRALDEKRAQEAQTMANKRRVAALALIGAPLGVAVAWLLAQRLSDGLIWGALAGAALGWASVWLRPVRGPRA